MLVLGVDPSSVSTGLALVKGKDLQKIAVWKPHNKSTRNQAMRDYYMSLHQFIDVHKPDMAIVEELAVFHNKKTIRVLAHFEGITLLVLSQLDIITYQVGAGKARNLTLGIKVTSPKSDVLPLMRKRFPKAGWSPSNSGGEDEADAAVLALAGAQVARGE